MYYHQHWLKEWESNDSLHTLYTLKSIIINVVELVYLSFYDGYRNDIFHVFWSLTTIIKLYSNYKHNISPLLIQFLVFHWDVSSENYPIRIVPFINMVGRQNCMKSNSILWLLWSTPGTSVVDSTYSSKPLVCRKPLKRRIWNSRGEKRNDHNYLI